MSAAPGASQVTGATHAPRTQPRFPTVPLKAGHYESFYVKLCHPDEPIGVWIRYTVHKRPNERPKGSLWFTYFDAAARGPQAAKVTLEPEELGTGPDEYLHIGESIFEPGRVSGKAETEQLNASWELRFDSPEEPLFHLPRDWMYRAPIPKTKLLTPYPGALFSGYVNVGGGPIAIEDWQGMVGHNWGAQHAERWLWLHGANFEGKDRSTWFDGAVGRIKLGPVTTPWIANGTLSLDGVRYRVGGPEKARSTEVRERTDGAEFTIPGKDLALHGVVGSDQRNFVGWVYADPDGSEHNTVNCSISDMTLTVVRPGRADLTLAVNGGAAYELGMRETDHGVPIQPFPDG